MPCNFVFLSNNPNDQVDLVTLLLPVGDCQNSVFYTSSKESKSSYKGQQRSNYFFLYCERDSYGQSDGQKCLSE